MERIRAGQLASNPAYNDTTALYRISGQHQDSTTGIHE
jgi:hypothetical protein